MTQIGHTAHGKHTGQLGAPPVSARVPTGVFVTLIEQHRQVAELLIQAGSSDSASKRAERWAEARRRLLAHERAEALEVYAALEGRSAADKTLEQHSQQAREIESAVFEMDTLDAESDAWIERLRDVIALLDDHVRDEESDFFPRVQNLLRESAADLDERYSSTYRDMLHTLA
jgi:hemerythrin superfamily protein